MKKKTKIISGTVAAIALLATGFVGYTFRDRLFVTENRANTTEYRLATEQVTEQLPVSTAYDENMLLAVVGTGYIIPADDKTEEGILTIAEGNDSTSVTSGNTSSEQHQTTSENNTQTPAVSSGNSGSNTQTPAAPSGNTGSNTQTPAAPTGNSGSNTQTPAAPTGNTGSGNGGSSTAGNQGSNAGKTWHPPVYENVWVVDREAWTEEIPQYEAELHWICNQCGADITSDPVTHITTPGTTCGGYHSEYYDVQVGTTTVNWPEEGHYERKLVKEGYWE